MGSAPTIDEALARGERWFPDEEAFVQADRGQRRSVTYAEAATESRRFAAGLIERGVERGDRVAFLTRNTVDHAVAYFGALRAGATPASLHHRESDATLRRMVDTIAPTALVFQPALAESAVTILGEHDDIDLHVAIDRHVEPPSFAERYTDLLGSADAPLPALRRDDRAFVNFSSGTTGVPKPVVHTHADVVESAHLGAFKYRVRSDDRTLKTATPSFIAWANATFSHVNAGATLVYLDRSQPEAVLSAIEREAATTFITVPTVWSRLVEADPGTYDLGSLRLVGYAGEPITPSLFRAIRSAFTSNVCAVYGSTETMSSSLVLFPEYVTEETVGSVGYPAPNTEVRVVDPGRGDPDATVEDGESGEVVIRGPSVAEEVWDDPETTRETFHEDGWVFTGDVGYVGPDGLLFLEGRKDDMIISGGINVNPERVRAVVAEHPDVADVAVVGVPDEEWGQAVTAAVVRSSASLTADDLAEHCRRHPELSGYQRPRRYVFVDALPRTGTGKVDRTALRDRVSGTDG